MNYWMETDDTRMKREGDLRIWPPLLKSLLPPLARIPSVKYNHGFALLLLFLFPVARHWDGLILHNDHDISYSRVFFSPPQRLKLFREIELSWAALDPATSSTAMTGGGTGPITLLVIVGLTTHFLTSLAKAGNDSGDEDEVAVDEMVQKLRSALGAADQWRVLRERAGGGRLDDQGRAAGANM